MLDQNNRRLLRELQKKADISVKDLAARTAMSPSTVWRRLNDLEAAGVIGGKFTHLDPEKLGLEVCNIVEVSIEGQSRETRADFERFAGVNDHILQCFLVTGSSDYTLITRHESIAQFEAFLMNELLAHPSVQSTQSKLVLRQHKNVTALPI